ncbi:FeoC-like transcriptional regulator [Candidatus Profftia tarda]|uniref:Ferrous iron transport protein C n=1 Tax=Candidatus Profftia tarda TaxID=1177216 RepID=A0A8E4F0P2_9ENTR|nr:FeoC-like transcriptional regulator [Candidatus Profftia tarda]CAD6510502.1 Ferrous iron transport protein C [Candidatus Profftia tarda]
MAILLEIRNTLALHGQIEFNHLCRTVNGSPAIVSAMLELLEKMGLVKKADGIDKSCLTGRCTGCLERHKNCHTLIYIPKSYNLSPLARE